MKLLMENWRDFVKEDAQEQESTTSDTALTEDMEDALDSLKDHVASLAAKLGVGAEKVLDMIKAAPGAAADAIGDTYDTVAELPGMGPAAEPVRKMLRREDENSE